MTLLIASRVLLEGAVPNFFGQFTVELEIFKTVGSDVVARRGEYQARNASPVASDKAHRARLTAGVHDPVRHEVPPELLAGVPQCHDFGMRRWVLSLDNTARPLTNDLICDDENGTEGGLAFFFQCSTRYADGVVEEEAIAIGQMRYLIPQRSA